uniref:Uncharacterized protein n=1 Tax=Pseudo-nitzschia australis TaxID=44445 RepID=A0A7S4AQR6_9STRA|mmetsp:Transcript_15019/g.32205  ORF Transcript_15019/g.32205 Transcript_15019/m.32205 type:complete len:635 (+) Transcript_15019:113-2017(+)
MKLRRIAHRRRGVERHNKRRHERALVGFLVAGATVSILLVLQSMRGSLDASSLAKSIDDLHFMSAHSAKAFWNIGNSNNDNTNSTGTSALPSLLVSRSAASISISTPTVSTVPTIPTASTVSTVAKQQPRRRQRLALPKSIEYYKALRIASVTKDQEEYKQGIDKQMHIYRSCCGLGHRFLRQAAAFRYARDIKLPHLWIQWSKKNSENCGLKYGPGHLDLFEYYFGVGPMVVLNEADADLDDYEVDNVELWDVDTVEKQLKNKASELLASVRMDFNMSRLEMSGNHEKFEKIVGSGGVHFHLNSAPEYRKSCVSLQTREQMVDQGIIDDRFYRQLKGSFRSNDRVRAFAEEHHFSERLVLGIHIRAGNGETGDFVNKKRGIEDIDSWVVKMAATMDQLIRKIQLAQHDKVKNNTSSYYSSSTLLSSSSLPPLLFVATDDGLVVGKMANATKPYNIEAISLPQERMETGSGVSYKGFKSKSEDNQCKESWFSQIADAILLGAADVVIAARYSSFTQSLPLVSVLSGSIRERKRKRANGEDDTAMATDTDNTSNNMGSVDGDGAVDENETNTRFSRRLFCEGNGDGNGIQCYDDYLNWMLFKNQLFIPSEKVFRGAEARAYYSREVLAPCPLPQK